MTAVLALLENLVDVAHSVKLHFFFAVLLTVNESWSRHKYQYANGCLRAYLHPFMARVEMGFVHVHIVQQ